MSLSAGQVFLTVWRRSAAAVGAALWSSRDGHSVWTASPRMTPITQRFVEGGWGLNNPRYEAATRQGLRQLPRFFTEDDLFDSAAFVEHPFFADFMLPEGLGWSASTSVNVPDHDLLALSVERAWQNGPIPPDALALLDRLRPHLARSAMIAGAACLRARADRGRRPRPAGLCGGRHLEIGQVLLANSDFEAGRAAAGSMRGGDRIVIRRRANADALLADSLTRLGTSAGVRSIPLRPPRRQSSMP